MNSNKNGNGDVQTPRAKFALKRSSFVNTEHFRTLDSLSFFLPPSFCLFFSLSLSVSFSKVSGSPRTLLVRAGVFWFFSRSRRFIWRKSITCVLSTFQIRNSWQHTTGWHISGSQWQPTARLLTERGRWIHWPLWWVECNLRAKHKREISFSFIFADVCPRLAPLV